MEKTLIRMPFGMFVFNAVAGFMIATSFPVLVWLVPVMLVAALAFSIFAAFFATRYSAYHRGMSILMRLNFSLFAAAVCETIAEPFGLSQRSVVAVVLAYLVLLSAVYLIYFHSEKRAHWLQFATSLASPTLVVREQRVARIVRPRTAGRRPSSSWYAPIGSAIGVAMLSIAGASLGTHGNDQFQAAVGAALILSPLVFLRYMMPYFVGISEVRRVERLRGARFAFDNLEALQRERATLGVARLLNPLLRQPPRPSR